ncbi:MAG TPA: TonB family protein [Cellvibrio sp.]|nr:TonB family protein [Cellvibrio sp.]
MQLMSRIFLCLVFLWVPLRLFAQDEPGILNGIAIHSEFGRELFIGALYSPVALNEKMDSLDNILQLRMELKILAPEGMTLRRFYRLWHEGMSVNNDPSLLRVQADNRALFDKLFKDRLQQNDYLIFSYQAKTGVTITLNNILLGKIASDDFFKMLLSTWVGSVPLSSHYKNAILKAGDIDSDLIHRFANSKSTLERSQEIAGWLTSPTVEIVKKVKTDTSVPASATTKQAPVATSAAIVSAIDTRRKTAPSTLTKEANETSISSDFPAAKAQAEPEKTFLLSAQAQAARKSYIPLLLKKIRSNTRYPARANEHGQGGRLRIMLTIDRAGNLLAMQFIEESAHDALNQAAINAIKQSQPLPPIPDVLPGMRFEFTVPISFVPGDSKTKN